MLTLLKCDNKKVNNPIKEGKRFEQMLQPKDKWQAYKKDARIMLWEIEVGKLSKVPLPTD